MGFIKGADDIFFDRSVYEQHHVRLSINFAMHKIRPSTVTAGTVKNNNKGTVERCVASDNALSFLSSIE